jgi:hypothetical protein
MTVRLPQSLGNQVGSASGPSSIERELMGEKVASLGRAGRLVQQRLKELGSLQRHDAGPPPRCDPLPMPFNPILCSVSYAALSITTDP